MKRNIFEILQPEYGSLTKHEIKRAGYWPNWFSCASVWTEAKSMSINTKRKEKEKQSSHLYRRSLFERRFIKEHFFSCGTKSVTREGKITPFIPFGWPIKAQNFARSRSFPYND